MKGVGSVGYLSKLVRRNLIKRGIRLIFLIILLLLFNKIEYFYELGCNFISIRELVIELFCRLNDGL